ncbi:hypothetical protein L596_022161 [Steinernema carpocapsae]|uniref:Uncharacterized protein n=1 Tax=Steinernema carpocapsae TaxID=34508 RepID=A0A4U5MKZ6_STECR|nr:hypothetical protein L596_022161 [Steinernema carpocapsae]
METETSLSSETDIRQAPDKSRPVLSLLFPPLVPDLTGRSSRIQSYDLPDLPIRHPTVATIPSGTSGFVSAFFITVALSTIDSEPSFKSIGIAGTAASILGYFFHCMWRFWRSSKSGIPGTPGILKPHFTLKNHILASLPTISPPLIEANLISFEKNTGKTII